MGKTNVDDLVSPGGIEAGSADIVESELETIDDVVAGVVSASKAIVVDSHKHIDTLGLPVGGLKIGVSGSEVAVARSAAELNLLMQGVAAGYKVARGEHTQVAASDTVVSGLATVVAVIVSPRTRTVKQLFFNGSPGDQAGAPAAGSFLITSQKPTAVNDVTPVAATDFTDNIVVDWIAIGT